MNQCVFCESTEKLTITMQVATIKGNITAYICAEHEDEASPKKVRELLDKKLVMLDEFERKAKELGFKLVPVNNLTIVSTEPTKPTEPVKPTKTIENKKLKKMTPKEVIAPVSGEGVSLERHNSYDTTKDVELQDGTKISAPGVLEHEEQVIAGMAGVPTAIPKKIVSEAGTTEINIVDTGGDKGLQDRFKALQRAETKNEIDRMLNAGYVVHECRLCGGTGITKINKQKCPKCKGAGSF